MAENYATHHSPNLLLRPVMEEDAEFIRALMNTPSWLKYIGDRKVHTNADAAKYIRDRMLPQLESRGFGNYMVIRQSDAVPLGTCGIYEREGMEDVDLGFAFLPEYEGQGYAYEAAQTMLQAAKDVYGLARVTAFTTFDNVRSQRLLRRLGMLEVGTTYYPGDDEELALYVLDLK